MRFRFIHAADLHLDSPLLGLSQKSPEFAARVEHASRQAFDNLVSLAIDEDCKLIVIAGDLFDGNWRDYRTGQFFVDRMRPLRERGVRIVMILGNHDAANPFAGRLELSDNVTLLPSNRPHTIEIDEIGVAVHGRSFPRREVLENIALDYPKPLPGRFNIGLLHTAGTGREGHDNYAPCSVEQLANHGYDYWALGHIHAREVLSTAPPIVFSGNLQGRSIKETGAKGATLVTVDHHEIVALEHRPLDVVRFGVESIDVSGLTDRDALFAAIRARAESAYGAAEGRALALRVALYGQGLLHAEIAAKAQPIREEVETLFASIAADLWLEKLVDRTEPSQRPLSVDPTVAGGLAAAIAELAANGWLEARLAAKLAEIRPKLPAGARAEDLFDQLQQSGAAKARALALALIEQGQS
ncbi:metallophosphoesterase [Methylocella silvestris BL2]|uniref:Metallophosphoesterase n=1 Tax=Methylocella silvestris (strain DSM 15510 / CIP 108128 / LMG 27833 / NCIMB 13906 / BL2) TaxID=395965 RepID=B8ET59_METSB|nr:DNA repair exonuclease [Methylocella silvestris]ACK51197.1 metallophosphoesterase [Methylocella silvestris BL2]